jgi:hypothetical protein
MKAWFIKQGLWPLDWPSIISGWAVGYILSKMFWG